MFENLTDRLQGTLKTLRGQARLTDENMKDTLREVRMALLEADVALPVVKEFIAHIRERAAGTEVQKSLTPGQALIKIVSDELTVLMGEANEGLNLSARPPVVILVAGLQGAGKTTTVGKLAKFLIEKQNKKVGVVSVDIYRPAAIAQLEKVAGQVGAEFFASSADQKAADIATAALDRAKKSGLDVLLVDSAGRLHVDDEMMAEIQAVHEVLQPVETLYVADSMTGQDAVNSASAFDQALPLTGVILTKTDGDARGGAALSIRQITGKPIKFLGAGEKLDALEPFYPDRVASRILGMGDVLSLVEEIQQKTDLQEAEKLARKISKGDEVTLEDFRDQLNQMQSMGGMASLMDKMPGMGGMPGGAAMSSQMGDQQVSRMIAVINSMTPQERQFPAVIKGSRKRRIAAGSGTQVQDVNRLLKQFMQMQKMMKKMKKGGMKKLMRGMPKGFPGMPM
jgi:signal recognition particle subunit SRP54